MSKTLKNAWNIFTTVVVALVLVLALLLGGAKLLGYHVFAVLSGSMEPTYKTGSLIYVKELEDPAAVSPGTAITYTISENTVVTHRVVEAVADGQDPSRIMYRTKGDANENADGILVSPDNVIGAPVFSIPLLGYVANFIKQPPGSYLTMSFAALFVLLMFMPELLNIFLDKEDGEEKPEKKKKRKGGAHCAR